MEGAMLDNTSSNLMKEINKLFSEYTLSNPHLEICRKRDIRMFLSETFFGCLC